MKYLVTAIVFISMIACAILVLPALLVTILVASVVRVVHAVLRFADKAKGQN